MAELERLKGENKELKTENEALRKASVVKEAPALPGGEESVQI